MSRRQALLWLGGAGLAFVGVACSGSTSKIAASSGSSTTTADDITSSTSTPAPATTTSTSAAAGVTTTAAASAASGTTASTSTTAASGAATTSTAPATTAAATSGTTAVTSAATCVLAPEMTEGPYYIAGEAIRSDITEGKPGTPLALVLTVTDAATCAPIKDATVEIWHADAAGDYSGFGGGASSRTYLRGGQVSDASGKVTFATVYPGWYQGRATHIHLKAHVKGVVHTTQLFFDEQTNDTVYARAAYSGHSGQRTRNTQDNIFSGGGSSTILALTPTGTGYTGALTLGVKS